MTLLPMPRRASELSAEWLTHALQRSGALPSGRVSRYEAAPMPQPGQTSEVVRLTVRYDPAEQPGPATLVAKFAAPFEAARAQMHALGLYEREVRFYQEIGSDAGIPVPRCHHADIDLQTGDFVLLLEDLEGRNGNFWHGSVEDAEEAIRHLAPFHAKWWEHPKLRSSSWLRQPEDMPYYQGALGALLPALIPVVAQKFPDGFTGYLRSTAERLAERWDRFVEPRAGDRYTLVHCDYHPKQLFFADQGRGRFAVFDWQSPCVLLGACDLQRVLLTCLEPAQLMAHQTRLMALYHRLLTESGVDYALSDLTRDTSKMMLWTLYITVFALGTTDVQILQKDADANGKDLEQVFLHGLGGALEYNDVRSMIP